MKYGIIVSGKVTEPVTIPTANEGQPLAWLSVQFPTLGGPWVQVSDDAAPGATYNSPGNSTNPGIPAPAASTKTVGLSWGDFRKLLTSAENEALDNYDDGTIVLTAQQKRKIKTNVRAWEARGADRLIDVTTAETAAAIDYLVARGFISGTNDTRKNEIIAGTIKS